MAPSRSGLSRRVGALSCVGHIDLRKLRAEECRTDARKIRSRSEGKLPFYQGIRAVVEGVSFASHFHEFSAL
jgi:hypothetical protein